MWIPWERAGLDHLFLQADAEGVLADGVVIGASEGEPFRLRYRIRCDARWRVRELMLESLKDQGEEVRLLADGTGFTADLAVDADGLVLSYPELFRRVAS
jgi:hypothetical protein